MRYQPQLTFDIFIVTFSHSFILSCFLVQDGETAIFQSSKLSSSVAFKLLLEGGADVNIRNKVFNRDVFFIKNPGEPRGELNFSVFFYEEKACASFEFMPIGHEVRN